MALLPIILHVTTDIYEKMKLRHSNDDKTDVILIYVELVQSIGSFTLQKVQKSLYLAGIFYQAYY
jgi:hypothetical protein